MQIHFFVQCILSNLVLTTVPFPGVQTMERGAKSERGEKMEKKERERGGNIHISLRFPHKTIRGLPFDDWPFQVIICFSILRYPLWH